MAITYIIVVNIFDKYLFYFYLRTGPALVSFMNLHELEVKKIL